MRFVTSLLRPVAVLALVSGLLAIPPSVQGCSCGRNPPVAVAFKSATSVFVGTVQSIRPVCVARLGLPLGRGPREWQVHDEDAQIVVFAVSEAFKGDRAATVSLLTDSPRSSCYFGFEVGSSYLVYAYERCGLEPIGPTEFGVSLPISLVDRVRDYNRDLPCISSGMCTRTARSEQAAADIAQLRTIGKRMRGHSRPAPN